MPILRILHVVQPPRGGAPAMVEMLVSEQVERHHQVGVVCRPGVARRLAGSGARVWALPMVRGIEPVEDFRNLVRLSRIVRSYEPDVIHAHSSKAGALGRLAGAAGGVPVVFSPHNFAHTIHEGPERVRRRFLVAERALAPLTDQLHLSFEGELQDALSDGLAPAGRTTVIPNGIDPEPLLSLPMPSGDPPTIGTYARLWPQKRIDRLLSAAASLADRDLEFRLAVVGEGPLRGELERQSRDLGLAAITRFLDDEGRTRALEEVDLYVISSAQEAFPLVPMEAMAAGRPVVATDVGALPEIVEDGRTGLIVAEGDQEALTEAIAALITDPELRARLGEAGRERARERFAIAATAERLEELYRAASQ